ncbi:MAG: magnesium transporter CorA family protein [Maritimibacter sp.]|nr:magnesium transporter CorA family protein [Maritimibacter sp.]
MLYAYRSQSGRLARLVPEADLKETVWIDLYRPQAEQIARVEALGVAVPTLEEMEEIEISSRLYREDGIDYMTVVLPGLAPDGARVLAPITFIVCDKRLITVRHHVPRPFETFPERAGRGPLDRSDAGGTFLGLADEIIARFADILEEIGRALDALSEQVFSDESGQEAQALRGALKTIGQVGDRVGRVRLGLLTMERALSFYDQTVKARPGSKALCEAIAALQRDIAALGVHADFVYSRISLVDDATLGMISLDQNATVRIFSIVAVLFMPPTLVASIYGMNFRVMPELASPWGYPAALGLMVVSAAATYLFFRWRKWL